MISASQIRNAEFSHSARGYKASEVDDILEEAAVTIDRFQKENEDLSRKLDVLAEKIKEYREDEESIKQALVTAQRTADSIIKDARSDADDKSAETDEKVREAISEATKKAAEILKDAEDKAKKVAAETKERSLSAIAEAKDKSGKMILEVADMRRKELRICEEMKKKATEFRVELLNLYKNQVEVINKIPESVTKELEFEKTAVPDVDGLTAPEMELPEMPEIPTVDDNIPDADATESADTAVEESPADAVSAYETESGGFEVEYEPESTEPAPSKFGNLKFGEDYDPEAEEDEENSGEDENSEGRSFFRRKK